MIRLLVTGEPSTITAQQKGVNWRKREFYTKTAVKAEARRIRRSMNVWVEEKNSYVPLKTRPTAVAGPLHCSIKIVYPMTQELAKKHADKLGDPNFEVRHPKRPDVDNSIKLILDTLTKLGFWEDDGQIDDLNLHKRYGTTPRIAIAFRPSE